MFRAYCTPGGPDQNQRRRRLAHPERPRCPISVQRQADWKTVFLPPNIPTPPERVSRGRAQQSMRKERELHGLSYPRRIGQRLCFLVPQAIAAATWAEGFAVSYPRSDRTASISAGVGVISRWCYIILYCNGLCGKDAPGGLAAEGGPPAVSIVWGPWRPTG